MLTVIFESCTSHVLADISSFIQCNRQSESHAQCFNNARYFIQILNSFNKLYVGDNSLINVEPSRKKYT